MMGGGGGGQSLDLSSSAESRAIGHNSQYTGQKSVSFAAPNKINPFWYVVAGLAGFYLYKKGS